MPDGRSRRIALFELPCWIEVPGVAGPQRWRIRAAAEPAEPDQAPHLLIERPDEQGQEERVCLTLGPGEEGRSDGVRFLYEVPSPQGEVMPAPSLGRSMTWLAAALVVGFVVWQVVWLGFLSRPRPRAAASETAASDSLPAESGEPTPDFGEMSPIGPSPPPMFDVPSEELPPAESAPPGGPVGGGLVAPAVAATDPIASAGEPSSREPGPPAAEPGPAAASVAVAPPAGDVAPRPDPIAAAPRVSETSSAARVPPSSAVARPPRPAAPSGRLRIQDVAITDRGRAGAGVAQIVDVAVLVENRTLRPVAGPVDVEVVFFEQDRGSGRVEPAPGGRAGRVRLSRRTWQPGAVERVPFRYVGPDAGSGRSRGEYGGFRARVFVSSKQVAERIEPAALALRLRQRG